MGSIRRWTQINTDKRREAWGTLAFSIFQVKGVRGVGSSSHVLRSYVSPPLIILIPVGINVEQQTDEDHVCDEGGTSVAQERQR